MREWCEWVWSEPTSQSLSYHTAQHYEWLQVQSQLLLDDRNPSIIFGKPQLKVELANHSRFHWNWFANAKFDNAVWSFWNCKLGVWSSSSVKWEKLSKVLFCCCCCRRYTRFSWNSHSKLRLRCGSDFPRCILNHVFQVSILDHCGILSLLCWSRLHLRDKRWSLINLVHLNETELWSEECSPLYEAFRPVMESWLIETALCFMWSSELCKRMNNANCWSSLDRW